MLLGITVTHISMAGRPTKQYLDDINNADKLIKSRLFRPPYGKSNLKSEIQKNIKL